MYALYVWIYVTGKLYGKSALTPCMHMQRSGEILPLKECSRLSKSVLHRNNSLHNGLADRDGGL